MVWSVSDSVELYGVDRWGADYFGINGKGQLTVHPMRDHRCVALEDVVARLRKRKLSPPFLFRFPQILEDRVKGLQLAFAHSIAEFEYPGEYKGVFPFKVNQRREVIAELLRVGKRHGLGLEVGSKAELMASLTLPATKDSLLLCNGYKDDDYLRMATWAAGLGKKIFVTVDEVNELHQLLKTMDGMEPNRYPLIGLRAKLYSRGSGKWAESGGEKAKFGLTSMELLECIDALKQRKLLDRFRMLHFHIGSQITEIRRIHKAIQEAGRIYAKVKELNPDVGYFNVGGGLGVDYDGSHTSSSSSVNYGVQEYANTVVYALKYVCDDEDVECPTIVSESGRALVAYHSMLVTNVKGRIPSTPEDANITLEDDDPHIVEELYYCWNEMNAKNYEEYYHDALMHKDELIMLFNLGQMTLREKAKGEVLLRKIMSKVSRYLRQGMEEGDDVPEEFESLLKLLSQKYITNFSLFQSVPDHWAIKQLFPIMPIQRLKQKPGGFATLADITCDSDGVVDKFVDLRDIKELLEVHALNGEEYYLAFLMLGAYQDTLGDFHNLFGRPNEAHVLVDKDGGWHVKNVLGGHKVSDILKYTRYEPDGILEDIGEQAEKAVEASRLSKLEAKEFLEEFRENLDGYTYLEF